MSYKAVVFDLDYTLWRNKKNTVVDKYGYEVTLYEDVVPILEFLRSRNIKIFTASRTASPPTAKKLIKLFNLEKYIDDSEWGWGSKKNHISKLAGRNNIEPSEMCLFDDEYRNRDVEEIGVKFCYLPNEKLTWSEFNKHINPSREH
ncbi:hypothetical protein KL921_000480 [Ogataea angusta]|nr:hypothetical protein KL921_000480 [Ogataea angusta]